MSQLIYHSTHSNLTFPNTNPQPFPGQYSPSSPPLPTIHSARCVKVPLTKKKCFSVTYVTSVGIWTTPPPPSPPSLPGDGNVPCAPLWPPHPKVHYNTSASPLLFRGAWQWRAFLPRLNQTPRRVSSNLALSCETQGGFYCPAGTVVAFCPAFIGHVSGRNVSVILFSNIGNLGSLFGYVLQRRRSM